jgi:hypothetical protein
MLKPTDEVMNQVTPTVNELPITFRTVKRQMLIDTYIIFVSDFYQQQFSSLS